MFLDVPAGWRALESRNTSASTIKPDDLKYLATSTLLFSLLSLVVRESFFLYGNMEGMNRVVVDSTESEVIGC